MLLVVGAGSADHAVALVLAVAVEVALVLVADADVALEVDVVVLETALGVDLVVEGGHRDEVPGTDDDLGGGLGGAVDAVAQLVVDVGAEIVGELHAARRPGQALGHEQVRVAAERVDDLPVLLARAAPTVGWQGLGLILLLDLWLLHPGLLLLLAHVGAVALIQVLVAVV